jgi:hypothetical protein
MVYRIPPGSLLDQALNVLVSEQTGEPAPPDATLSVEQAVDLVDRQRADHVLQALGTRAWLAVNTALPVTRSADPDDIERRWYGGVAA